MDNELIRKAAEAIHVVSERHMGEPNCFQWRVGDLFSNLPKRRQEQMCEVAEAALKVFLEHTRAQPREQVPPKCPDCGAMMLPSMKIGRYMCPSCGKVQDG